MYFGLNFIQKIRKVLFTDFSQNFKNLILVQLGPLFDSRTAKNDFPKQIICVNFQSLCYSDIMQKIQQSFIHRLFIKSEKPHFRPKKRSLGNLLIRF